MVVMTAQFCVQVSMTSHPPDHAGALGMALYSNFICLQQGCDMPAVLATPNQVCPEMCSRIIDRKRSSANGMLIGN